MRRLIFVALALAPALLLAACGGAGTQIASTGATVAASAADAAGLKPPVTLGATTLDEKAAIGLLYGYDAFLFVIDTLDRVGALPPTSTKAHRLADLIDTINTALRAALAAQKAGNATTYTKALSEAKAAYALAQQALGSN